MKQSGPVNSPSSNSSLVSQIAVLVDIDDTWGRNIVQAISQYAIHAHWQLLIAPRDNQGRLRIPAQSRLDGAIVSLRDQSLVSHVRRAGVPTVNVSGMFLDEGWAGHVATDDLGRAKMAIDHLASRCILNFASYCPQIGRYNDGREQAFAAAVREAGHDCHCFTDTDGYRQTSGLEDRSSVAEWIDQLPKPIGIFAADPYPARQLVEVCIWRSHEIPEEVAILSGDEDDLLCESVMPSITSIELASHRIGTQAGEMLAHIMQHGQIPTEVQLVQPLRVRLRRSTENRSIDDPAVASCLRLIWEQAPDRVEVRDLVKHACLSRRTLEQRFRQKLGRTPAEEIRRMRLEKSRQMIVSTSHSISTIAVTCGFSSGPYLSRIFRKYYGISPSELRVGRTPNDNGNFKA